MLQEFYRRVDKIMRLEIAREAVHAGRSTLMEALCKIAQAKKSTFAEKNSDIKKHKSGDHRQSPDAYKKKAKSPDQRILRPILRKYNNFTNLIRSREDVFFATEHIGVYKRPDSLREDR